MKTPLHEIGKLHVPGDGLLFAYNKKGLCKFVLAERQSISFKIKENHVCVIDLIAKLDSLEGGCSKKVSIKPESFDVNPP